MLTIVIFIIISVRGMFELSKSVISSALFGFLIVHAPPLIAKRFENCHNRPHSYKRCHEMEMNNRELNFRSYGDQ